MMILNNLTSGYHRDLQLLKESLMNGIDEIKDNLEVCHFMLQHIQVKENILDNKIYDHLYSVEEVNKLVMEGTSFREAYQILTKQILENNFSPEKKVNHTHEGSIRNLCLGKIQAKFDSYY